MTFDGRQPLIKDNFWWRTNFNSFWTEGFLNWSLTLDQVLLKLSLFWVCLLNKNREKIEESSSVPLSGSVFSLSLTKRQTAQWNVLLSLCQVSFLTRPDPQSDAPTRGPMGEKRCVHENGCTYPKMWGPKKMFGQKNFGPQKFICPKNLLVRKKSLVQKKCCVLK